MIIAVKHNLSSCEKKARKKLFATSHPNLENTLNMETTLWIRNHEITSKLKLLYMRAMLDSIIRRIHYSQKGKILEFQLATAE